LRAFVRELFHRVLRDVESVEGVTGLQEVRRHRAAHIAQSDKRNRRHEILLAFVQLDEARGALSRKMVFESGFGFNHFEFCGRRSKTSL
jgi:hypothetical protein